MKNKKCLRASFREKLVRLTGNNLSLSQCTTYVKTCIISDKLYNPPQCTTPVTTCSNYTILSSGHSWVTFCSHIFCDVCVTIHVSLLRVSPVCEVSLYPTGMSGVLKLRRINIEPSNEEKMVSLAGLSPRNMMEMCMAGLSFHQHQVIVWRSMSSTRK